MTDVMQPLRLEVRIAAASGFQFYVYALSDASGIFYIGKGQRGRVFEHRRLGSADTNEAKQARIRSAGVALAHTILAYFNDEDSAYAYEASLIATLPGLTNRTHGDAVAPIDRVRQKAASMLPRIVPFDRWVPPEHAVLAVFGASPREAYDRLVAEITREATEPTPTTLYLNRAGAVTDRLYNQRQTGARYC